MNSAALKHFLRSVAASETEDMVLDCLMVAKTDVCHG